MEWISIKERLPPCCGNGTIPYVLAYHTVHGTGVAWFWQFENDGLGGILEEEFDDKYICSCQFIFNMVDGNYDIACDAGLDIFENSPHFLTVGTVTHWMPLPDAPGLKN